MNETSRAAVIDAPGRVRIRDFSVPAIEPDEALLAVELVGVCSTDAKIYAGDEAYASPLIPGHEIVGRIAEIGDQAREEYGVSRGDRVVVFPFIRCDRCGPCRENKPMFCEQIRSYGTVVSCDTPPHLWGGYSQYLYLAPGSTLFPLDDHVPPEVGILVSAVLGNGIRWTDAGRHRLSYNPILIQGVGPQGLAATIAADHAGASTVIVTGIDGDEARLEMARRCGADLAINVSALDRSLREQLLDELDGTLPPTVVDVTGSPAGFSNSIDSVADEGTVVVAGLFGDDEISVPFDELLYRDVTLRSVFSHRAEHAEQAVHLIESTDYPFEELVTHVYELDDAERAIRLTGRLDDHERQPIKVAIKP